MVRWSFGIGEEGLRFPSTIKLSVVIIDSVFPCWWSAAKSVGLIVSKIWLTSKSVFLLKQIKSFVGDIEVINGPSLPLGILEDVRQCTYILIGGPFPDSLAVKDVWGSKNLSKIITTSGLKFKPPSGWQITSHRLKHSDVGGVTDGVFTFTILSRSEMDDIICVDETPGQDLRAILKTGEPGTRTMNLSLPPSTEAACTVRYCGKGTIEEASLWTWGNPSVRIKTKWRNLYSIERELGTFERLLAADVSEKLIRQLPEGLDRDFLMKHVHTPGKVLYAVLSHVHSIVGLEGISESRKRDQVEEGRRVKRCKVEGGNVSDWKGRDGLGSKGVDVRAREATFNFDKSENTSLEYPVITKNNWDLGGHNDKATKNDSASVRFSLWHDYLVRGLSSKVSSRDVTGASNVLRTWLLCRWKLNVTRSYLKWKKEQRGKAYDNEAQDCISRAADATWWTWDVGSRPFFWRWPADYVPQIRDGHKVWFDGEVNPWTRKQRESKVAERSILIRSKLDTIREKRYVEPGTIISLMSYFDVPKGEDDIRMVYDGSASGLNDKLWAPWFSLPNNTCLVRALEPGYWMADNDVGEMFHNFMLNEELRCYCGLDFLPHFKDDKKAMDKKGRLWLRWNRLAMGLRPSPYCAVQGMMMAKEIILGDRNDQKGNVFHWDRVRLNLPGSESYHPAHAWVTKVRVTGEVAADVFIYVDDIRCSAPTQAEAWTASQRTSSVLGSLGIQDAARKRRDPGQETGAWTGTVVWTSRGQISIKTTQEKWDKVKLHLRWIVDNMENKKGLENRRLQSIRGFLVYVAQTYGCMVPYLKGLHATIDSWRTGRSPSGWKLSKRKLGVTHIRDDKGEFYDWDDRFGLTPVSDNEPEFVFPVPRFRNDVKCLLALTSVDTPPTRVGRMSLQAKVMYGFGDASKHGFGASIELPDKSIIWRFGQWRLEEEFARKNPVNGLSFMEERSSNYRELRNLVEALESAYLDGLLRNREIFMFTDNSTAEAAFFKGTSSSELLFDLVLRLRKIEMTGDCIIHMIHVAGTRMIYQGTDGLSRGDKTSGVMAGESMLSFVPLHLSVLDRSPLMREWVNHICEIDGEGGEKVRFLEPSDWPESLCGRFNYIWTPPPAAGDVAAEYMAQAIHKRPNATHIYICPRLMTSRWQRIVRKTSDLFLYIPCHTELWGHDQHEPLILAISLPLSRHRPWKHGGTPRFEHYSKILPGLFAGNFGEASAVLRECIARAWGMAQV